MKYFKKFKISEQLYNDVNHMYQPNGFSCGNTVIKMLIDYYDIENKVSIDTLIDVCGSDGIKGTTDIEMIKGFKYLNIPYEQNTEFDNPVDMLIKRLNTDSFFVMRTLTKGIKHWILVLKYDESNDTFKVLDPWLGKIEYNTSEIISIWEPRNYDGFFVPNNKDVVKNNKTNKYTIEYVEEKDIDEISELAAFVFGDVGMDVNSYVKNTSDWNISLKLLNSKNEIIGFYCLADEDLPIHTDKYEGNGLHGVALGIHPDYKGQGLGKLLIEYPSKHMKDKFDYIWGMQLKVLNNIDDWLKRRELVYDAGYMYITAAKFS